MQALIPFEIPIQRLLEENQSVAQEEFSKFFVNNDVEKRISWISKFVFDKDYSIFKQKNQSTTILKEYLHSFQQEPFFNRFKDAYPVLPSLTRKYVEQSEATLGMALKNFQKDKKRIEAYFNDCQDLGTISSIDTSEGDAHNNGQTTAIFCFKSGQKIVYKPRAGHLDIAYNEFLQYLNSKIEGLDLKTYKAIDCDSYSWIEFIEKKSCISLEEINQYYLNAGALLAILYLFRGTDIHFENVIAHGKSPVIIDLECLFSVVEKSGFNVLDTCFLPYLSPQSEQGTDFSGMGANGTQTTDNVSWKWINIGSDELSLEKANGLLKAKHNQPVYQDKTVSPKNHVQPIFEGFKKVCNWFLNNKKMLLSSKSPLVSFQNQEIRILIRSTQDYTTILENSFIPSAFSSKKNRNAIIKVCLDKFNTLLKFDELQKEKILEKELSSIENINIPLVTTNTTQCFLKIDEEIVLDNYFKRTPYSNFIHYLTILDEESIEKQLGIIKSAFIARYNVIIEQPVKKAHSTSIKAEVAQIANKIEKNSISDGKSIAWATFNTIDKELYYQGIPNTLYDGTLGIIYFYHALVTTAKKKEYQPFLEKLISDLLYKIENAYFDSEDLSFSSGLSGMIYLLLNLGYENYEKEILKLSELITEDIIITDKKYDNLLGSAGCLSVLVEVYKKNKAETILNKCKLIGEFLLVTRVLDKISNCKVWVTSSEISTPLTGFAHGVSGIALSLLKLWEVTGIKKYKSAFYEAIEYENTFFNTTLSNWQDLRTAHKPCQIAWCHGAPGIGLTRIYGYRLLKDERLLGDLKKAVKAVQVAPLKEYDFYCCGNIGTIDFLIEANKLLKNTELHNSIKFRIKEIIKRKGDRGFYNTYERKGISMENPSLFRGLSGIGYTFLRYVYPEHLPCFGMQGAFQ